MKRKEGLHRMEKEFLKEKRLSARALIESARQCVGRGHCIACDFCDDEYCDEAMKLALADKLEELLDGGTAGKGIEWILYKAAKPTELDEYLVMIAGATKPTTLFYDPEEEMFYEEGSDLEPIYYPVTHWAELPEGPEMPREKPRPTVKRCATCRHEDRLGDEERCLECEKHNLWEERK